VATSNRSARLSGMARVSLCTLRAFICEEGFEPKFGARPLRRTILRGVDNELSQMVLSGSINPGDKVVVDAEEGGLTFDLPGRRVRSGEPE
jgi:ATP-dependent Clp protease ATP-binding subunit ClpC